MADVDISEASTALPAASAPMPDRGEMTRTTAVGPIGGIDDNTMDDIIDKLKVLNYEKYFCIPKSFKPLHRYYFSVATHNPAEQFHYFASLVSWLMSLSGHTWQAPNHFDDPNVSSSNIISELKQMELNVRDVPPGRLRQGYGDAVQYVLNTLCDKALVLQNHSWRTPEFEPDNYRDEDAGMDDGVEDEIQDEAESDEEFEEEFYEVAGAAAQRDDNEPEIIETHVDAEQWRLELERVAPLLKVQRRADTSKDWRAHVDWINQLLKTIDKTFPDVRGSLDKIVDDLSKALEKIQKREQALYAQFETWVDKYRVQKKDYTAIQETLKESQDKVAQLSNELNAINELMETMKTEIQQKEEKMTDTTPLMKIKDAMGKIKGEVKEMELRIGVLQHEVLKHNVESRFNRVAGSGTTGSLASPRA